MASFLRFLRDLWTEWWLGLQRSLPLFRRPVVSLSTVWRASEVLNHLGPLLKQLSTEGGVVVDTPPDKPLLRSRISPLGDVTLLVEAEVALTAETVLQHQESVRERLRSIDELSIVLALVHGLITLLPLLVGVGSALQQGWGSWETAAQAWFQALVRVAIGAFASALLAVSRRWLVRHALSWWLGRLGL